MSIVFACSKFHEYVYSRKFLTGNDHKPLKTILAKPISEAPARIQSFMLNLQKYDFDIYETPGKLIILVDTLSTEWLPSSFVKGGDWIFELNEIQGELKFFKIKERRKRGGKRSFLNFLLEMKL